MELIIQEILEKITSHCEKGLEELIMKKTDISGFIMDTKKMLDEVGKIIVADTLETINRDMLQKLAIEIKELAAIKRQVCHAAQAKSFCHNQDREKGGVREHGNCKGHKS